MAYDLDDIGFIRSTPMGGASSFQEVLKPGSSVWVTKSMSPYAKNCLVMPLRFFITAANLDDMTDFDLGIDAGAMEVKFPPPIQGQL